MKITCIVGNSYLPIMAQAARRLAIELQLYSTQSLIDRPSRIEEAVASCENCDLIFLHRSSDAIWDEMEPRLREIAKSKPLICLGYDQAYWMLSTAPARVVVTANAYLTFGGEDNICNMLLYLAKEMLGTESSFAPPFPMPWEGAYHPDADHHFESIDDYLKWYEPDSSPTVGLLFSRFY